MHKHSLLSLLIGALMFVGCATQTRTVRTETSYDPAPASYDPASTSARGETRTHTTTETSTETAQEGGLVSGTVDVVGKTIAFPFRVVGGLVDMIF